ncbi:hypothetical protein AVEN_96811-1 [Araneus ventricosus]|uniref:Uncharacterized protein n=1 Tax=Araneus ventricosus TaxID=182803 RepID=A0A4Y2M528_ARAVE|nr:hypothetical protein AVEN_96811-1 [Araneus ventricosus]
MTRSSVQVNKTKGLTKLTDGKTGTSFGDQEIVCRTTHLFLDDTVGESVALSFDGGFKPEGRREGISNVTMISLSFDCCLAGLLHHLDQRQWRTVTGATP